MAREGIEGGFGVALEMSGAQPAISQCIASLAMGGKLAMLGIPAKAMEVNWSDDHPESHHHQGRLWPRDVRDLAQDVRPDPFRAGPDAADHPPRGRQ